MAIQSYQPSAIILHLPGGDDLVLYNRVKDAKGKYGKKLGTNQSQVGTCILVIDDYDNLVNPTGGGQIEVDDLEKSSITIAIGGRTLFSGRVRSAVTIRQSHKTDVKITLHDAMSELTQLEAITLPFNRDGYINRELTGNRINRILDHIGWGTDGTYRRIEPGTIFCGLIDNDNRNGQTGKPIQLLQQVANTEWGRFGVAFGFPTESRSYNRGTISFVGRNPAPAPWITVDNTVDTLGDSSVRSDGAIDITRDKTELRNVVRFTAHQGVEIVEKDEDSISTYGEVELPVRQQLLSNNADARAWAKWILTVYGSPRISVRKAKIKPYFYDAATCLLAYQLSIDKTVRVISRQRYSDDTSVTIHRIDRVSFHLRPGDNTLRGPDGSFIGGAICDMELDLQIPEASAYWNLGVRGSSELDSTTILAGRQPDEPTQEGELFLRTDIPPPPYIFPRPRIISADMFNALILNKQIAFYADADQRNLLRVRPTFREGNQYPSHGDTSILQDSGLMTMWNGTVESEFIIAQPEGRQVAGRMLLDDPVRGRLDIGNTLD